jgi:hypothetical protein
MLQYVITWHPPTHLPCGEGKPYTVLIDGADDDVIKRKVIIY